MIRRDRREMTGKMEWSLSKLPEGSFDIPVLNNEIRSLMEEIQRKQKARTDLENRVTGFNEQINAVTEHVKSIQQQRTHTQALCRAVEKQKQSEMHVQALGDRETGWCRQEIAKMQGELTSLRERMERKKEIISKGDQKVKDFSRKVKMDRTTFYTWLDKTALKEEDTMTIAKYEKQDDSRIRELTLSIEKLTLQASKHKKALEKEQTGSIMTQVALERTAELFQEHSVERQEMITELEKVTGLLRKKDEDLHQHALLLVEKKQMQHECKTSISEKQNFHANELKNQKECEKKIAKAERQAEKLLQHFQKEENNRTQLQDELVCLKSSVGRTATDLEAERSHVASAKKDINTKTTKLEDMQSSIVALKGKLQGVTEKALSMEERAAQRDQLQQEQEKRLKELKTQIQLENKLLFQKMQEVETLKAKNKNFIADMAGSRVALSSLDKDLNKLNHNAVSKQDYVNSQDFQIQLLEDKMARLAGKMTGEEKKSLERQVSELTSALEGKKKKADFIATDLKKLQTEIRCAGKENEKILAEKQVLTTKTEELDLIDDSLDKDLKRLRLKKQDSIVENSIQELELQRLRSLLYDRADGVLSQEKRKQKLQTAMKERQKEISVHLEMYTKQIKTTEQEMQQLRAQLHELVSKVEQMKTKYEIVSIPIAAPEGEEEKSQAHYIKMAAQEKEELQQKCDDLEEKIRKAERESKALKSTVFLVNHQNSRYRESLTKSGPEYQEKMKLEEQKRLVDEKSKLKRRQIKELQENLEVLKDSLTNLQQDEAVQRQTTEALEAQMVAFKADLKSQQEKLDRATKQSLKLTKEVRSRKNTKQQSIEERDIDQKLLKDCKNSVNKMCLEAMEQQNDLKKTLHKYFVQAGIALPCPTSTPLSKGSKRVQRSSRPSRPSVANSPRSLAVHLPSVKMVDVGLGVAVSSSRFPPSVGSNKARTGKKPRVTGKIRSRPVKKP